MGKVEVKESIGNINDFNILFLEGGVGYFSNESGFSVESSLQRISSKFLLCKRNDLLVVL